MAKEMGGSLSKNKNKTTPKHPDIKGSCQIDGVAYWISGWARKDEQTGDTWYSLSFSAKSPKETKVVTDDDVPF